MLAGLFSLISISTPVPAQDTSRLTTGEWENVWTRVLTQRVDGEGRVDFRALKQQHNDLDRVVAFVAVTDPFSQPQLFPTRQSRLAYYINAYNALAMYGVIHAAVPESLGGLTKFTFFYLRKFTIGGRSLSLYSLENDVIRPLGDERVHFALNCMVVSCPRLREAAFTAGHLDRQLDEAAREFVSSTKYVRFDAAKREVWLSGIFSFYTKDFLARAPDLIDYVNRYRVEQIPSEFRVRFLEYDWTVNALNRSGLR